MGKTVVDGIDDNEPRYYPLDDKEKIIIIFPRPKKEETCIKIIIYIKRKKKN